ncbi:MAG: MFS transporter, partial [Planctomycetota bacterium]
MLAARAESNDAPGPVRAVPMALLTFLASLGTGIVWNALYFIAERTHGFDQKSSLILAFANGVLYTVVALRAGWTVRTLERRMSPRAALGVVLLAQALLAPLVMVFPTEGVFWLVALTITGLGALQWPIVQHYLVSGRHGPEMRNTIGWWNASWMLATAVGLAATGPLERYGLIEWAIPSLLPINLLACACASFFPRHPPAHDPDEQARHVPPTYRSLLASSRILHPMGYLVIGALAPILPYLFENLKTQKDWQAPLGSVWHLAR